MSSKTWTSRELKKLVSGYIVQPRLPQAHKTHQLGRVENNFPVCSSRLPHISFPLGASCWLGPMLSDHTVFIPEAVKAASVECLAGVRLHRPPPCGNGDGQLALCSSKIYHSHLLSFFSSHLYCIYFWAAEKCAFLIGAMGKRPGHGTQHRFAELPWRSGFSTPGKAPCFLLWGRFRKGVYPQGDSETLST